ncbi:MAG: hypothetical protein COA33_004965 [Fluviicola sp.]|nr:hypothetical protein [Fluviicola sp.]
MKGTIILILVYIAFGCKSDVSDTNPQDDVDAIEFEQNDSSSYENLDVIEPSAEFIQFVKEIGLNRWIHDTSRVNKVQLYGLKGIEIHFFDDYPFYSIPYNETQVHIALRNNHTPEQKVANEILSKTKQIWGYFYRDSTASNFISDGVIEQWCYDDSTSSQLAYDHLKRNGGIVYFNTMPFFYRKNNNVFIFHTRAMAFSYDQKNIYEQFVARLEN